MLSTSILTLTGLISSATAIITGVAVPSTIAPGSTVSLTLTTANYIQSVADISVAFALSPAIYPGYLGADLLGSFYLGPSKSNVLTNITFDVAVPANVADVKYLTAIITSLYGATHGPVTTQYNVPITIGKDTSDELSSSTSGTNVCTSSSSSVARDSTSCFPSATTSIIQSSIGFAGALIGNIDHGDNSTGRQNLGQLNGYLGDLSRAIVPGCSTPPASPWPPLSPSDSKIRAIGMLRQVQDGLNALQGDVLACEVDLAKSVLCQVLAIVSGVAQYYV
ncbi:uncharacterized protein RCC_10736 [Ramularia collo-cygni]|uniref:Uncharacterized protein n=1 Tax=Ramularia collo-cygni TaxID=112498 RepID=A0A2D3VRJ8_9PEZI|nr:uncharacterized protein RCC_10736 [Ramularia collo-cygni]CZT25008.1 uncharacterized protein RCC_10736 [Ramularia collo-cygni]